ncbi:unnamed protein product, partial [Laminaria digitata]
STSRVGTLPYFLRAGRRLYRCIASNKHEALFDCSSSRLMKIASRRFTAVQSGHKCSTAVRSQMFFSYCCTVVSGYYSTLPPYGERFVLITYCLVTYSTRGKNVL